MDNAAYVPDDAADRGTAVERRSAMGRNPAAERVLNGNDVSDATRRRLKELEAQQNDSGSAVQLPRTIGPVSGSAILIGSMVGAGIFIFSAEVLRHSGSVGATLVIWLVCCIVAAVGALCYVELGLLMPEHGGDFTYLLRAFGPLHPFLGKLPAFLLGWLDVNATNPAGTAILSLAFAQYCVRPWYGAGCDPPFGMEPLVAVFTVLTITAANCVGIHWSTRLQTASTISKMTAMAIIVSVGMYSLSRGNTQHLATGFQGTTTSSGEMVAAFFACFYAYGGWNSLNNITEEVKDPPSTLPLSILCSLPIVAVFYVLVNVAYLAVLSPQEMLSSPAVAFTFGERALGPAAFLMPLGVALSVFGTLNSALLSASRINLAVARRGHHLHALSLVHVRWMTPIPALIFHSVIVCTMILNGSIGALLRLGSIVGAFFSVLVSAALLVLRQTMEKVERPYRVPTVLVWFRLLFCCYLLISPIVDQPRLEYLYALGMLALGLAVYTPCVYFKWSPPVLARLTLGLQKALALLPAEY